MNAEERGRDYWRRNALLAIALVAGIGVLANILVRNHLAARVDLTEDRENSISEPTKRLLAQLPAQVNVRAYITQDVPPHVVPYKDRLEDILEEYRAHARGRLSIAWIDPSEGTARKEAEDAGVAFIPVPYFEGGKRSVKNITLGLQLQMRDRRKLIPAVWITDLPTVEYQLTTAIKALTDPEKKSVGFLTSEEPAMPRFPGMEQQGTGRIFETARNVLEDRYAVVDVDAKKGDPVPEEVDVLVVARPKDFPERTKFEIDQFLMRGGRILFLVDRDEYPFEMNFFRRPVQSGLDDLFEHYGFRIEKDLIVDKSNLPIQVPGEVVEIMGAKARLNREVPYPFWIRAGRKSFSAENPITSRVDSAAFLWANPVTVLYEKAKGLAPEEIVRSSEASWRTDQVDKAQPDEWNMRQLGASLKDKKPAPSPIAVCLSGKFTSLFAGKEAPKKPGEEEKKTEEKKDGEEAEGKEGEKKEEGEGEKGEKEPEKPEEPKTPVLAESPETRILVFGDSDFISDRAASSIKTNVILFMNAIDWLSLDHDLVGIRSKTVRDRRIVDFEQEYAKEIGETSLGFEELFTPGAEEKVEAVRTNVSQVEERAGRTRGWIKWGNMLGMPAVVVASGLFRLLVRRRKRDAKA